MTDAEIKRLRARYHALQDQVRKLDFIAAGSVIERYTVCGTPGCRCHNDPPTRHGPYFQYSRKLDGKTLTRRLTTEQAQRYREWISNRRTLDDLIDQMDQISRQVADLLDAPSAQPGPARN
jgi:hypothetical protein